MGMSPQSRIEGHEVKGLMPARVLKPRWEIWRDEAARMARGPKRAPRWMGGVRWVVYFGRGLNGFL
jgi:hypothetical protein